MERQNKNEKLRIHALMGSFLTRSQKNPCQSPSLTRIFLFMPDNEGSAFSPQAFHQDA